MPSGLFEKRSRVRCLSNTTIMRSWWSTTVPLTRLLKFSVLSASVFAKGHACQRVSLNRGDHRFQFSGEPLVIRVEKGNVLPGRMSDADITCYGGSAVSLSYNANTLAERTENFRSRVSGTVVDHHDLMIVVLLRQRTLERFSNSPLGIVGGYYR